MEQVVVIFVNNKKINSIRKKYDPGFNKFKNHISLVYPFQNIKQKIIYNHIKKCIKGVKPFKIVLNGLQKSAKDYYLYLLIEKGNNILHLMYNRLHSKILTNFKNPYMPKYIPHITLGVFKNSNDMNKAIKEISKMKLKFEFLINKINLLTLDKNMYINKIKEFKL